MRARARKHAGDALRRANRQVKALGVCLQTVKLHRGRMMRKLRLDSIAELVRLAEKAQALPPEL